MSGARGILWHISHTPRWYTVVYLQGRSGWEGESLRSVSSTFSGHSPPSIPCGPWLVPLVWERFHDSSLTQLDIIAYLQGRSGWEGESLRSVSSTFSGHSPPTAPCGPWSVPQLWEGFDDTSLFHIDIIVYLQGRSGRGVGSLRSVSSTFWGHSPPTAPCGPWSAPQEWAAYISLTSRGPSCQPVSYTPRLR